jgi:hypothetical protein
MQDNHALSVLGYRPTRVFAHFPYLVTRVVPTMYHITLLPEDLAPNDLLDIGRRQRDANRLPVCIVTALDDALYLAPDGTERSSATPPEGGIIVTDRFEPCRPFLQTPALRARRAALDAFIDRVTPRAGGMLGDISKGGRPATFEESVALSGLQPTGIPRGLTRCSRCREWRGCCIDPSPEFARQLMEVHCRCENDNRCAACGDTLHAHKLNANFYSDGDGGIWHVPGFSAFGHRCPASAGREESHDRA